MHLLISSGALHDQQQIAYPEVCQELAAPCTKINCGHALLQVLDDVSKRCLIKYNSTDKMMQSLVSL